MKFSNEERAELLSKPIDVWPLYQGKREPLPKQKLLFIEEMPVHLKPHMHPKDCVLFQGGRRCFGIDTPILMYDGTVKPVQDVVVGDLLMGPDSQPRKVMILSRGQDILYKIIPLKGSPWVCNAKHVLSLKTSGKRIHNSRPANGKRIETRVTGTVENIDLADYITFSNRLKERYKLYKSETVSFPDKKQPLLIDPYFLGLWLGDGNSATPAITTTNPQILNFVYSYAESLDLILQRQKITYFISSGTATGGKRRNALMNYLKSYNLINNKHIPQDYLTASVEDRLQVLAGLLDTDGYLASGMYYEVIQKSKQLAEDLVFLARSLGISAYIKEVEKYCWYKGEKKTGSYYKISIFGDIAKIPCRIPYKAEVKKQPRAQELIQPFTVEGLGLGNYYGFEVSGPDKLFLLGDFTVVHNSGKTSASVALALHKATKYPGITIICGAKTYTDVKDIFIDEMKKFLTIYDDWDHPLVHKYPSENGSGRKSLILNTFPRKTVIKFMHFNEVLRLRGREADLIIMEEVTQIEDPGAFEEMIRSMSSIKSPILQIVLLTNPPESRNWLYDKFALKQFTPAYKASGKPKIPIGQLCNCHLCPTCMFPSEDMLDAGVVSKEIEWVDKKCPECSTERAGYEIDGKKHFCPGKQEWWRVILTSSQDNNKLPQSYVSDSIGSVDADTAALYIGGRLIELRKGYAYWAFTDDNVLPAKEEPDFTKEFNWSFDFNVSYQCSVVTQEHGEENKEIVYVVKEIVIPESRPNGPEFIVKEFVDWIKSYPEAYENEIVVNVWGDRNGFNRTKSSSEATNYQIILNELRLAGIKVNIKVRKDSKASVINKINSSNMMFRPSNATPRVFVNPDCHYLLASLDGVKVKADGIHIDESCDRRAAEDPDKHKIRVLTHITDALAYYLMYRFPIISDTIINPFTQLPGEESVELTPRGVKEKRFKLNQPDPEPEKPKPQTLWQELEEAGIFEQGSGLFYW